MNPHSHPASGDSTHAAHKHQHLYSEGDVEKERQGMLTLAQQINSSSREGHDAVNRLIMARFALGLQDYRLYREGILSFAFVYKTFEEEWTAIMSSNTTSIDPRIKSALQNLYSTSLLRTPQIAKDLRYYYGSTPFSTGSPTTLQRIAYVNHIRQVVTEKPHVLIAYAYNYYMALFAGGKILRYQMSKARSFFPERYGMTEEECVEAGTNIFSFEVEKGKEDGLRESFKGALCGLERTLTTMEKNDIIEESKAIYSSNILIIKELDQICAYIAATAKITTIKEKLITGKHKFMAIFAFLTLFLIWRHMIHCL